MIAEKKAEIAERIANLENFAAQLDLVHSRARSEPAIRHLPSRPFVLHARDERRRSDRRRAATQVHASTALIHASSR